MKNNPDDKYIHHIKKIGKDKKNIKIFENFLTNDILKELYDECLSQEWNEIPSSPGLMWSNKNINNNLIKNIFDKIGNDVKIIAEQAYGFDLLPSNMVSLVKWPTNSKMPKHMDDFAVFHYHISAIVYLNDNYHGGNIRFVDHDLSIKPKPGTLIIFPGNKYYEHEVLEITDGNRYTVPIWFKFKDSNFSGSGHALGFESAEEWKNVNWEKLQNER